ncbi:MULTISPECIES: hypothetical protein [unclassified Bradyrhizobium]|uniref:hypothetical protein n=1 Tax=unclassified Bradyrhizobium TaxID=2631580 RepID=UPI0033957C8A
MADTLLPKSEFDRLRAVVFHGLTNDHLLTEFDHKFLLDYHKKFEQYKRHAYVSDAQEEQFDRIEKYLQDELGSDYVEVTD